MHFLSRPNAPHIQRNFLSPYWMNWLCARVIIRSSDTAVLGSRTLPTDSNPSGGSWYFISTGAGLAPTVMRYSRLESYVQRSDLCAPHPRAHCFLHEIMTLLVSHVCTLASATYQCAPSAPRILACYIRLIRSRPSNVHNTRLRYRHESCDC